MKTYTVSVSKMWQETGVGVSNDLVKYPISWKKLNYNPIQVSFNNIPAALLNKTPLSMKMYLYADFTAVTLAYETSWATTQGHPYIIYVWENNGETLTESSNYFEYNTTYQRVEVSYFDKITEHGLSGWNVQKTLATGAIINTYILNGLSLFKVLYTSDQTGRIISGSVDVYGTGYIYSPLSDFPPYAVIEYDEGTLTTYGDSPRAYAKPTVDNTFTWHTTWDGFPVENLTQTSATLYWKDGANGEEHSISIADGATSYTMPANTLPESSSLMWRVIATTAEGTSTSTWQTLRTTDAIPTTAAVSPSGSFLDGSEAIRFSWTHNIDTGTEQTAYELQYLSGGTWTTAATGTTADQYCDLPANTLPSGSTQWRVKTCNQDGVYGEYSNTLPIVVVAAPLTPSVSITLNSPRPEISWTSNDQQAYETRFGGQESGLIWGTGKTAKSPIYLADGINLISVRVCNAYNMWSSWGTASVTVANVPGDTAIMLTGTGGRDAELSWTALTDVKEYWIYRAGKRIAVTTDTNFTDRYFLGTASYFVRAAHDTGDTYTDSNAVTLTMSVDAPMITAVNGQWISLRLDQTDVSVITASSAQSVALMQYVGAEYPVPETSPYKTQIYNLSTAFTSLSEAANFGALVGKLICYKDQYGNCITGIMTETQRMQHQFFTAYSVTIQRVGEDLYAVD